MYSLFTFLTILMLLTMSVSAQAAGVKTPGKVTVTRVRLTGSNNVTVYWKKAKNATNYRIYYKQAGAKSWKGIATVGAGRTSYTHNSSNKNPLIGGSKYVYTVRAYNRSSKNGVLTIRRELQSIYQSLRLQPLFQHQHL